MKLSTREIGMAWVTLVIVLLGLTYWIGRPALAEWRESRSRTRVLSQKVKIIKRKLLQRESWEEKLKEYREKLPQHPADKDVTAELLKMLEQSSRKVGLTLIRREPSKEKHVRNLYESSINCTWEGKLESLVRFLYDVQVKGVVLDVKQLSVSPAKGAEVLKGSFTINFAYNREAEPKTGQ